MKLVPRRSGGIDRAIGACIAAERKARGMSQRELGLRLGFTPTQLHKYESGASRIPAATLVTIGRILNLPVARFLPDETADDRVGEIARHLAGIEDPALLRPLLDLVRALTRPRSDPPRSAPQPPPPPEIRCPCR